MASNAAEDEDCWIAREVATTLNVLSLQSNPLKESPEAAVLSAGAGAGSGSKGRALATTVSIELQRLEWLPEARTFRLSAYPEPTMGGSASASASTGSTRGPLTRAQQLLLAPPIQLELFFPESPADPPLCFGSTDTAALVAERVNELILPLERSSLLHAVSRITAIIKQEVDSIWPPSTTTSSSDNDPDPYLRGFHRRLSQHLTQHPKSADLLLALLSMAKPHHPSVRFPLPRFFYRGQPGKDAVDQPALLAALHAIPPLASLVRKGADDDKQSPPPPSLPFASCVLLHHLFFRSRVALLDPPSPNPSPSTQPDNNDNDEYQRLLDEAGITGLVPSEQPALVFRVAHSADARFTRPAQRHGTRVGFHGSPPANFYSIVALGLRNLSGTRGMRNGAVFGEGVYLASKLEVAREFGDWGTKVWPHSAFGTHPPGADPTTAQPVFPYQVIALCEFLALDQYTKHLVKQQQPQQQASPSSSKSSGGKAPSEYYVVEEDEHLCVRMLLLFKDPTVLRRGPGAAAAAGAGAGATAVGAAGPSPAAAAIGQHLRRQQQRRGWFDHLLVLIRAVLFLVALVLLLDGLERLLVKTGKLHTPPPATGRGARRRAGR